jgi:hypothetical protein
MLTSNFYLAPRPRMIGVLPLLPLHAVVAWPGELTFFIASEVPVGAAYLRHPKYLLRTTITS